MAKTRQQKEAEVREVVTGLTEAKVVVMADLSPLKVSQSTDLRHKAREQQVKVRSAKKTLLKLASKSAGLEMDESALGGSIMLLLGYGDEVAPAKLVAELRKEHKELIIQGGLLENKWVSREQILALSCLPSKDELIAKVVGSVAAPLSGLVNVLQGNIRGLVYTLNAIKNSKS
ncbi:50S ribosomal protein L10 [Patescibacteria group bacterium]|nr:50S ribosomal protein L10 [Patescibacteria group bacterium]MBU1029232.1 50S ribosomal protein L10 [Patescibacteria group bacterium]MBU1916281.1 50S ribosomal protein L10 [Patescibacteria group bacterium]